LTDGVNGVTEAPTAKAAQVLDRYLAGVTAAVSSGRMAQALNNVSLQDWKSAMLSKGKARIAQGVQAAQQKFTDFMTQWLPFEQQLQARIASMPKGTLADSQARAAFAISYNAGWSKRLPGSS
jgi:hypothetical protein